MRPACLVLHGFGGAPFDVQPIVQALQEKGLTVRAPCLPGHCQNREAFARTGFADWYQAAEHELLSLLERGPCTVIGLSMGGTLSLALAQRYTLSRVVTIAAPIYLYRYFPWQGVSKLLPLVRWLRFVAPVVEIPFPPEESNRIAPHGGYEGFQALNPLYSFLQALKTVRRRLPLLTAPIQVLHSPDDQTVPVDNAWEIASRVSSPIRRLELLPISERITTRHVLTTHMETKDRVREAVLRFVLQDGG